MNPVSGNNQFLSFSSFLFGRNLFPERSSLATLRQSSTTARRALACSFLCDLLGLSSYKCHSFSPLLFSLAISRLGGAFLQTIPNVKTYPIISFQSHFGSLYWSFSPVGFGKIGNA